MIFVVGERRKESSSLQVWIAEVFVTERDDSAVFGDRNSGG